MYMEGYNHDKSRVRKTPDVKNNMSGEKGFQIFWCRGNQLGFR